MVAQSNPGGRPWMSRILCFCCCACAEVAVMVENVPKPANARKTPARTINRPIKTRRLKKADCEADFFFMNGYMWMQFECGTSFLAKTPETRQHFFLVPPGLLDAWMNSKLFFRFFCGTET